MLYMQQVPGASLKIEAYLPSKIDDNRWQSMKIDIIDSNYKD